MKTLFLRPLLLILLTLPFATPPAAAGDAPAGIRQLFERYIAAWNEGDLMAIGSEVYLTPVHIYDAEQTVTMDSAQAIADLLAGIRAELDQAGFSHSELRGVSVCDLGGGLAFASFSFARYDHEGRTMDAEALSSAYIVRHTADGWRLAAHVMQSRPAALSCSG